MLQWWWRWVDSDKILLFIRNKFKTKWNAVGTHFRNDNFVKWPNCGDRGARKVLSFPWIRFVSLNFRHFTQQNELHAIFKNTWWMGEWGNGNFLRWNWNIRCFTWNWDTNRMVRVARTWTQMVRWFWLCNSGDGNFSRSAPESRSCAYPPNKEY